VIFNSLILCLSIEKKIIWCLFILIYVLALALTKKKKNSISYIKCIKTRLETMEKKRRAIQKFTKNDIVELLRSGHDYDAYKRV
jgi:hypothetical protein